MFPCAPQLSKAQRDVSKFASIFMVDVDAEDVQIYVKYFDITIIPSTVFFFNTEHVKMDAGTQDHSKFIGAFHEKQDFIDVVEVRAHNTRAGLHMRASHLMFMDAHPRNPAKIYNVCRWYSAER